MKYYSSDSHNDALPLVTNEMRHDPQLRRLWEIVLKYYLVQEPSVKFLFLEDYDRFSGYIPYLFLLKQRIDMAIHKYGNVPKRRQCIIHDRNITELGKIIHRKPPDISIGGVIASLNNFHRSLGLANETYLFEKTWNDDSAVVIIERACSYAESLVKAVSINNHRAIDLFKTCKVDYNNTYNGNSSLILSSLKYLFTNSEAFESINQIRKIDAIIVSAEAIKDYINNFERNNQNNGQRIIYFWNFITDFAATYKIPRIIISASAKKCLVIRNYYTSIENKINGYIKHIPESFLTGDFELSIKDKTSAKAILCFQDRDNHIFNYLRNIEIAWQNLSANLTDRTYTINRQISNLRSSVLSILPTLRTVETTSNKLLTTLDTITVPFELQSQKAALVDNLGFLYDRYEKLVDHYQEYINDYLDRIEDETPILIISDNEQDMNLSTFFRKNNITGIIVNQIDWSSIDQYFSHKGAIVFSLDFLSYGAQCWERLFHLGLSAHKFNAVVYFLGTNANLSFIVNAWNRFENCINETRMGAENEYCEFNFIDYAQFNKERAGMRHQIFEDIDQVIERRFERYMRMAGYRRPFVGPPSSYTQDYISIFFVEEEFPLLNVPEGRIFYLDTENDDMELFRVRAEHLQPGDRIIVIFDDRDSTYEKINETLVERNAEFRERYEKSRIWLSVLQYFIESYPRITLREILISNGMHPYHIQTVINWVNEGNVIPDHFESVMIAILNLINQHKDVFDGYQYRIGDIQEYIRLYTDVIKTPRELYRAIIRNIKTQEELHPSLIKYRTIFNMLRNNTRILTVQNIE